MGAGPEKGALTPVFSIHADAERLFGRETFELYRSVHNGPFLSFKSFRRLVNEDLINKTSEAREHLTVAVEDALIAAASQKEHGNDMPYWTMLEAAVAERITALRDTPGEKRLAQMATEHFRNFIASQPERQCLLQVDHTDLLISAVTGHISAATYPLPDKGPPPCAND